MRWSPAYGVLILLSVILCPLATRAEEESWESQLASLDADRAYERVGAAVKRGDKAQAPGMFAAGLTASHMHLAIAVGDAMRTLGDAWIDSKEFDAALREVTRGRDEDRAVNLARMLGAWGHPRVDEPLARLAQSKKGRVAQEALLMSGALPVSEQQPFPKTRAALEKALESRDEQIRMAACAAAGRRGGTGFHEALLHVIRKDTSPWGGPYAVRALERTGYEGGIAEFVKALKRKTKAPQRHSWLKAVVSFARPEDAPHVTALIEHREGDDRLAGVIAAARIVKPRWYAATAEQENAPGDLPDAEVPDLVEALFEVVMEDEDHATRKLARVALDRLGEQATEHIAERVLKALDTGNEFTRQLAIQLCGGLGLDASHEKLLDICLEGKDPRTRWMAARALGQIRGNAAISPLIEAARQRTTPGERERNAIHALGYIRVRGALDALIRFVDASANHEARVQESLISLERLTGHRFQTSKETWLEWLTRSKTPLARTAVALDRAGARERAHEGNRDGFRVETDRTMERGLQWLERNQEPLGHWLSAERGWLGQPAQHAHYTSLCLAAFAGAGYETERGRYHETLWRAAEFLAATQYFDGSQPSGGAPLPHRGDRREFDKTHLTRGPVEAFLGGRSPSFRPAAQRALDQATTSLDSILFGGRQAGGGMAYNCHQGIAALLAAGVGLHVDPWFLDDLDCDLGVCSSDVWGLSESPADASRAHDADVGTEMTHNAQFMRRPMPRKMRRKRGEFNDDHMTPLGLFTRIWLGYARSHPLVVGAANFEICAPPDVRIGREPNRYNLQFADWPVASAAMFQMGGRYWATWWEPLQDVLTREQDLEPPAHHGSWDVRQRLGNGRLASTAHAVLSLQSFCRYPVLHDPDR